MLFRQILLYALQKGVSIVAPSLYHLVKNTHISCGALVFKECNSQLYFLLLYREKTDSWHLPKGTRLRQETLEETAIREVYEETGFEIELWGRLDFLSSQYSCQGELIEKITLYFLAKPLEKTGIPDNEHDRVEWIEQSQVKDLLAKNVIYEDEALVIEKFEQAYQNQGAFDKHLIESFQIFV